MSVFYNIECSTRIAFKGVAIQGGDVISATPEKLQVCRGCTNTLAVYGAYDVEEGEFWTAADATVSGTLIDQFGNVVLVVALVYVSGSNGQFQADFGGFTFFPDLGRGYTFLIQGTDGVNAISVPLITEVINGPTFTGVVPLPPIPSP